MTTKDNIHKHTHLLHLHRYVGYWTRTSKPHPVIVDVDTQGTRGRLSGIAYGAHLPDGLRKRVPTDRAVIQLPRDVAQNLIERIRAGEVLPLDIFG